MTLIESVMRMKMMMKLWIIMVTCSAFTAAINEPLADGPDPCDQIQCNLQGEVCEWSENKEAACVCISCDDDDDVNFLCGDDGSFYNNLCEMQKDACMKGKEIRQAECTGNNTVLPHTHPCRGRGNFQPWIDNTEESYNLYIGTNISISCEAHGIPAPVVQWVIDSVPVANTPGAEVRAVGRKLIFNLVTGNSNGTYTCIAVNCASFSKFEPGRWTPATHSIQIKVFHDEDCTWVEGMRPATVTPFNGRREFTVGQEVIVRCQTSGLPKPTVQWKQYDYNTGVVQNVATSQGSVELEGDDLIFHRGLKRHEGTYLCFAKNCASRADEIVSVKLKLIEDIEHFYDNCLQNTWDYRRDCSLPKRDFYTYDVMKRECVLRTDRRVCTGMYNAHRSLEECEDRCITYCDKPPASGNCHFRLRRYYYDEQARMCKSFRYSGCGGNLNRFKTGTTCMETCHLRKMIIDDKLAATKNYTLPDTRQLDCPAKCDQAILNGYCRDDFIIQVQIISTQIALWFDVRVVKTLYIRNNTDAAEMKSLLVTGATVRLKMGHLRSCKCPDVEQIFYTAQGNSSTVLVSGRRIVNSLTIMNNSVFKLYTVAEEKNTAHFYPQICQLLASWGTHNDTAVANAKVKVKTSDEFFDRFKYHHG